MAAVMREKAAVVIVTATVASLIIALALASQTSSGACSTNCVPPGPSFAGGSPILGTCASGWTFATRGCLAGDFVYNITVETSSITFGEVLFHIETLNDTIYVASGSYSGFSILNAAGSVAAHYQALGGVMNMTSGWTYVAGTDSATSLTTLYTVLLDVGMTNAHGQGLSLVAVVSGPIPETGVLPLP